MLENCGLDECVKTIVPVPNIHSKVLSKVLQWCQHHRYDKVLTEKEEAAQDRIVCTDANSLITWNDTNLKRRDNIPEWDQVFMGDDQFMIMELLKAANYLNIPGLLKIGCKTMANLMKDKSPMLIRVEFNIQSDLDLTKEQMIFEDFEDYFDEFPGVRPIL